MITKLTPDVVSDIGNVVYTADQLFGGLITRDPNGAPRTDVIDTAENLTNVLSIVDNSFTTTISNTGANDITVTGGTGVTIENPITIGGGDSVNIQIVATNVTTGLEAFSVYNLSGGGGAGTVTSVFTRIGDVVAVSGDYTATQVTNTPAGDIVAVTVQAAINELDTEKVSNTLTSTNILVGNGSNVATGVAMSGEGTLSNTGAFTLGSTIAGATDFTTSIQTPLVEGLSAPTTGTHATNKSYVDNLINGLSWITPAIVLSTVEITVASPGATIDGVAMAVGERVLLNNQTTVLPSGVENGWWEWNGAAVPMTRPTNFPTGGSALNKTSLVLEGTYANTPWNCTTQSPDIIDTDALTIIQFGGLAPVTSVYTRTGDIIAVSGDYTATQITNTPAGDIAAVTVQAAINELDNEKVSTTLTAGNVIVGNGSNVATGVTMSGEGSLTNAGVFALGSTIAGATDFTTSVQSGSVIVDNGANTTTITRTAGGSDIPFVLPNVLGGANTVLSDVAGNGTLSWVSASPIPVYRQDSITAVAVPANASPVLFDTNLADSGTITVSSGVYTLPTGSIYKLSGSLKNDISASTDITYRWRVVTGAVTGLVGNIGSQISYSVTSNLANNTQCQAIVNASVATTVHLEILSGGGTGTFEAGYSNCFIEKM